MILREDLGSVGLPVHLLPLVIGHSLRTGGSCKLQDSDNSREDVNRL